MWQKYVNPIQKSSNVTHVTPLLTQIKTVMFLWRIRAGISIAWDGGELAFSSLWVLVITWRGRSGVEEWKFLTVLLPPAIPPIFLSFYCWQGTGDMPDAFACSGNSWGIKGNTPVHTHTNPPVRITCSRPLRGTDCWGWLAVREGGGIERWWDCSLHATKPSESERCESGDISQLFITPTMPLLAEMAICIKQEMCGTWVGLDGRSAYHCAMKAAPPQWAIAYFQCSLEQWT